MKEGVLMLKRIFCLSMALLFVCCSALALDDFDLYIKQYPKAESGECIVNDILFAEQNVPDDNNRVFYEIFVGSFSDSNGDGIGDLRGIINRMDYLNDGDPKSGLSLGVEGLWLTPIFLSPSYHKYDVTDFYKIDPQFGTMEDLQELIDLCHERDVKIILDLPINHTGIENRWFKNFCNAHMMQNEKNDYYNFYAWLTPGDAQPAGRVFSRVFQQNLLYESNFSDQMPEPDYDNPFVRETFLNVALHYLNMGVDGFRFDAAKYIYMGDNIKSAQFWDWYIGELKKVKPDVYTVAEVWDGDGVIDRYLPFTSCFHFSGSQVAGIIAETAKEGDVNRYAQWLESYQAHVSSVSDTARPTLFISNHDMDRASGYLTLASGQMKMAASLYILTPGSPFLYYGEEIGVRGSRGGAASDANRRMRMLWGDGDTVQNPRETTYNKESPYTVKDFAPAADSLLTHYKQLIMARKANPEIARGTVCALSFPDTKVGGFISTWEGESCLVLHNTTDRTRTVDLAGVTDLSFDTVSAVIGMGQGSVEGTCITLDGQTTIILR
ncbi:MAG: hypothetical protein IKJ51_10450 [Clostridia bacterium]|nr:hypothetical protein [Clostridia bacterium]